MAAELTIETPFDPRHVRHVIEMPVGEEQQLRRDAYRNEPVAGAIRRIEQDRTPGRLDQVAVRLKDPAAEGLVSHRWHSSRGCRLRPQKEQTRERKLHAKRPRPVVL